MAFIQWYKGTRARRHLDTAFTDLDDAQTGQAACFTTALVAGLTALDIPEPSPAALAALEAAYDGLAT